MFACMRAAACRLTLHLPSPPPPTPLQPACDKTFAQAAGEIPGLTLLRTILSQAQYGAALPDPGYAYTLFAPTDSAFTSFLAAFSERAAVTGLLPLPQAWGA